MAEDPVSGSTPVVRKVQKRAMLWPGHPWLLSLARESPTDDAEEVEMTVTPAMERRSVRWDLERSLETPKGMVSANGR